MRYRSDENKTPVIFRADKSGQFKGDVTAAFPCEPGTSIPDSMSCYSHVGQHGSCSMSWYHGTRAATPEEYAALKRELESAPYGYRLKVYQRMQPWMRDAKRTAITLQRSLVFVIRFIDPSGATSYWPEGFGFTAHAHAADLADAKQFADRKIAQRSLNGYVNPPAFWESERRHARLMQEKFRNWKFEVIPTPKGK